MKLMMLFLTFLCYWGYSQSIVIKNNDLIEKLILGNNGPVSLVHARANPIFKISDSQIDGFPKHIVTIKNRVFILVDRTGRVYEVKNEGKDDIKIIRIDSTKFYGQNGKAILYSHNDTIFSIGGNGFWQINGQLRYFSFSDNEWNILKINEEIPTNNLLFFKEKDRNVLYYFLLPYNNESTGKIQEEYEIFKLDVEKRMNVKIGTVSKKLSNVISNINTDNFSSVILYNLDGLFISVDPNNQYLLKFDSNEIYKLKNESIRDVFWGSSEKFFPLYLFENQNNIYYTRNSDSSFSIKSFKIGMNDFEKEPYHLFEPAQDFTSPKYLLGGSLILLLAAGAFLYLKSKKSRQNVVDEIVETIAFDEEDELKFNPIELSLIQQLLDASNLNKQFSVEHINAALGLGRKSLEIQKKGRTETINRINHKFKVINNSSNDLIERVRLKEDKRFYNYVISNENAQKIREKM